jgi:quaternary ammonium compound-resistance protein SugE
MPGRSVVAIGTVFVLRQSQQTGRPMAWLYILLADVFEVAWPFVLKRAVGLPRWTTALSAVVFALPIFLLLGEAVKRLPASTVYTSFVGIGTVGTAAIGILFFGESASPGRLGSFALVVIGLIGLKFFSE